MNIDRIAGAHAQAQAKKNESVKPSSAEPASADRDTVELSGARDTGSATYARSDVHSVDHSTDAARTARMESIKQQVAEGFYNSREVAEHVADRLLSTWHIESRTNGE